MISIIFLLLTGNHLPNPNFCYEIFKEGGLIQQNCSGASPIEYEGRWYQCVKIGLYHDESNPRLAFRVLETSDQSLQFKKRFFIKVPKYGFYLSGSQNLFQQSSWNPQQDHVYIPLEHLPVIVLSGESGRGLFADLSYIP